MTTEKEFGEALKNDQDTIVVEGDLAQKTIRIKATGKVAWGVCIAGLAIVITLGIVTLSSAGTAIPITGPAFAVSMMAAAPVAVSTMGMPATIAAVGIAIAGGGVGILNKLRKYRLEKISETKIILHKK